MLLVKLLKLNLLPVLVTVNGKSVFKLGVLPVPTIIKIYKVRSFLRLHRIAFTDQSPGGLCNEYSDPLEPNVCQAQSPDPLPPHL